MVRGSSYMFVTGPEVIRSVTHEEVTFEELGGADTHARTSGVAHFAVEGEEECLAGIRELLTFLPQNNLEDRRCGPPTPRRLTRRPGPGPDNPPSPTTSRS
jgi:acetyl-CoA carboxylase carboxyltransferase component